MTSLLLDDFKSNYEPDTNLLGNVKTTDIPLTGKTWLVHLYVHKNKVLVELF